MLKKIILIVCFHLSFFGYAHVVNYGSYRLLNTGKNTWEMQMTLKTSALHNKIIALYPELKGVSLHTNTYKSKIYEYLNSCVLLQNKDKRFQLLEKKIKISNHQTFVVMQVGDMVNSLNEISIEITCYTESNSHTKNDLTIQKGVLLKTISLDENNIKTIFNFKDQNFQVNTIKDQKISGYVFLILGFVLLVGVLIYKRIITKE